MGSEDKNDEERASVSDRNERSFRIGYTFDQAAEFLSLPSDQDRMSVRTAFMDRVGDAIARNPGSHVFPSWPEVPALQAFIDSDILGPDLAVTSIAPRQEHVWRQRSWVCETRFVIVKADTGHDLTESAVVQGITFEAHTYWISACIYH